MKNHSLISTFLEAILDKDNPLVTAQSVDTTTVLLTFNNQEACDNYAVTAIDGVNIRKRYSPVEDMYKQGVKFDI